MSFGNYFPLLFSWFLGKLWFIPRRLLSTSKVRDRPDIRHLYIRQESWLSRLLSTIPILNHIYTLDLLTTCDNLLSKKMAKIWLYFPIGKNGSYYGDLIELLIYGLDYSCKIFRACLVFGQISDLPDIKFSIRPDLSILDQLVLYSSCCRVRFPAGWLAGVLLL